MTPALLTPDTKLYGERVFAITPPKPQYSPNKLDSLSQSWQTDREDTFGNGGPMPGYPFMDIDECETLIEIPGHAYEHRLRGTGLLKPGHKLESSSIKQPEEGWDEIPEVWLTTDPSAFVVGTAHPKHPNVYLVSIEDREQVTSRVTRMSCNYKGIVLDSEGNIKPGKLKITVNGQSVNTSSAIFLGHYTPEVFTDESGAWNGWTDSRKTSFDTSKTNLIWTALSTTPPPTERVGLQKDPPRVPITPYSIFDEDLWISSAFTWNYPAGWKLASVQADQCLDKSVWLYTLTFEYNPKTEPVF